MILEEALRERGVCMSSRSGGDWRLKSLESVREELENLRTAIRQVEQLSLEACARVSELEQQRREK